ncbi:MAG TPA: hypothetical protein VGD08_07310 [Stellaceae bacterium]
MSADGVAGQGEGRWLHAVAGGCELLLDGGRSQHVWAGDVPAGTAEWQGRVLPAIDLSALLAPAPIPAAERGGARTRTLVAYGAGRDDPQALVLAVDAVRGLAALPPDAVVGLPPLSAAFGGLFDGIAVAPVEGSYPLCVRRDLDPAVLERLVATQAARGGGARPGRAAGGGEAR